MRYAMTDPPGFGSPIRLRPLRGVPDRSTGLRHLERHAGLEGHEAADLPAAQKRVGKPAPVVPQRLAGTDWQIVAEREHQALRNVARRKRPLVRQVRYVLERGRAAAQPGPDFPNRRQRCRSPWRWCSVPASPDPARSAART